MKALILAAGKGTRNPAVTISKPKPMIEFQGSVLLLHNIRLCKKHGIEDIFINTHHFADQIQDYFQDGSKYGVRIRYSHEPELLGTAGALNPIKSHLNSDPFFVLYGDNVSDYPLDKLSQLRSENSAIAAIGCHWLEDISQSGVVECGNDNRILRFVEKPKNNESESHWVNSGVYCLSPEILSLIPRGYSDFGHDIFPALIKNFPCYALRLRIKVFAFDTPQLSKRSQLGSVFKRTNKVKA
jgi:NDP-sugar pyrophosphorylase family protein